MRAGADDRAGLPRRAVLAAIVAAPAVVPVVAACGTGERSGVVRPVPLATVALPPPSLAGTWSLEQALSARHSVREYAARSLTRAEIGQLLWAGQGQTRSWGGRTAPSAGAKYPIELYAVTAGEVLHYLPAGHRAQRYRLGPGTRAEFGRAALGQDSVTRAPLLVAVTVVPGRTRAKYGDRGNRYADLEAGHVAQNVLLQAVALGLGGVPVGAFDDARVADLLPLGPREFPRYLIALGVPAAGA